MTVQHRAHMALHRGYLLAATLLIAFTAQAQTVTQPRTLILDRWSALVGSEGGLYGITADNNTATPLWTAGNAKKVIHAGNRWFALGDQGIVSTADFQVWDTRNAGLPVKVMKKYADGKVSFEKIVQELKDLEVDAKDPDILVTATKDTVFISRDGGVTWKSLGTPAKTNGLKAVAVASMPELTVFASHGIYGIQYLEVDKPKAKWTELNLGLEKLETTENPDEISDIAITPSATQDGVPELYAAQSFKGRIYRLDWSTKTFQLLWSDGLDFGTVESLDPAKDGLRFVRQGGISEIPLSGKELLAADRTDIAELVRRAATMISERPQCLVTAGDRGVALSELALLGEENGAISAYGEAAAGHQGIYLPVNHAADTKLLDPYLKLIDSRKLDMIVVDMKDDLGRLRFTPKDPAVAAKGRVFNPVDLDTFIPTMKGHGVWTVARIVVFKDAELAKKDGGKYAVWDAKEKAPWVGYYETKRKKEPQTETKDAPNTPTQVEYEMVKTYSEERWVDPYSEEVWDYIANISRELVSRGFDEIQFDYIRFPTDGDNLEDARYRKKEAGMDMESAILSFLAYARARIPAPISIDIYGANGWYRTGARTGQEVELLSHYVDVICPMYYPSHFEQYFLANAPAEERPYRIYYRGTLRTKQIARGKVVVRPYVQSFYLNVSYDKKYYGLEYVEKEVDGVRDAGMPGLTYWNNVGRYDEIPVPKDEKTASR